MAQVVTSLLGAHATALERALIETGHNTSNLNTTAFQKHMTVFKSFQHTIGQGEKISYAIHGPEWRSLQQGGLKPTGDTFHVAVSGEGFFRLEGGVYTRAGELLQDQEGVLRTSDGRAILDEGDGAITIPPGERIRINAHGRINSLNTGEEIATLGLYRFEDPQTLRARGDNTYLAEDQEAELMENRHIVQGYLEASNTQTGQEMIELNTHTTTYQQNVHMIQSYQATESGMIQSLVGPVLKM